MRTLVWFRSDLRTRDNTALHEASRTSERGVVGVFVISPEEWAAHDVAGVRVDLVLRTLRELSASLSRIGIPLLIQHAHRTADVPMSLLDVARRTGCDALAFNREYEIDESRRDAAVSDALRTAGLSVNPHHDQAIIEPGAVRTNSDRSFTVFTPFSRAWLRALAERGGARTRPAPRKQDPIAVPGHCTKGPDGVVGFEPHVPDPSRFWPAGEVHAMKRLRAFARNRIDGYRTRRDHPADQGTSTLSPYLAVGSLSPRQCLAAAIDSNDGRVCSGRIGPRTWVTELIWREFYIHVLAAFPRVCMGRPFKPATERLPWRRSPADLAAWQQGRTGFPIVDAGMRQLQATGWMHNRLRMITAMFLAKDLFIDWRLGERHFMRHLVDGFFASNNGGWQWSASTGTDAVPYFRLFNPASQSRRYDPDGEFIRRYVPELAPLDAATIHDPPAEARERLGYPAPIVDHAAARIQALAAFKALGA